MINFAETVASSNATANIAYVVCIVSFFVAGGVAIYLLWDKIQQHNAAVAKKGKTAKSKVTSKKTVSKKASPTKKTPAKRISKKK